jgi:hypothetical protein
MSWDCLWVSSSRGQQSKKMGPIGGPEMSVNNCQSMLHSIPEREDLMEAVYLCEILVTVYQSTWCHIPEHHSTNLYCYENLTF